nr:ORF2 [Torque teno felis virus]QYD02069.1 ORF2 [Torque teno felis virus]QYD02117.1 ORF2 [Torque teno felis virus]QYD02126.1 ORF2 [Torque teno felis virus]QYD02198.1 ORF2 [Torque teno felis virus]
MEKPFPGPNVMLPALNLSDTPDLDCHLAYKKRQALWLREVSESHRAWCLCGSFRNHFVQDNQPLKNSECSEGRGGGEEDVVGATMGEDASDAVSDQDMVAAGGDL